MAKAPSKQTVRQRIVRAFVIVLLAAILLALPLIWLFKGFLGSDMRQAQLAMLNKEYSQARKLFERVLQKDPENNEALLAVGYICVENGDWNEAIKYLDQAEKLSPNIAEIFIQRGRALHQRGLFSDKNWRAQDDYHQAYENYTRAIELKPRDARPWLGRAMTRIVVRRYREALDDLNHGLKLNPENAQGWERRAYTLFKLGRYDMALHDANKAAELNPRSHDVWNTRGHIYLQRGQFQEARQDFTRAIRYKPLDFRYYIFRGAAWRRLQRLDNALADYEQAKKIKPDNPAGYNNAAIIYCLLGQSDRALEECQAALNLDSDNEQTLMNRALIHEMLNDLESARKDYNAALEINHEYGEAIFALALLDIAEGDIDTAEQRLLELLKEDAEDFAIYRYLGYVQILRDNPEKALEYFQQAIERMPVDFTSQLRCYILHSLSGDKASARESLKEYRDTWRAFNWPKPIAQMMLDEITTDGLIMLTDHASARVHTERLCEAWHFIGSQQELAGDHGAARRAYQNSVDSGALNLPLRRLSIHALERMNSQENNSSF